MKMPETIYVGLSVADADFVKPLDVNVNDAGFHGPHASPDVAGGVFPGYIAEYRLVRLLEVTKTTPAPIITVQEVPS